LCRLFIFIKKIDICGTAALVTELCSVKSPEGDESFGRAPEKYTYLKEHFTAREYNLIHDVAICSILLKLWSGFIIKMPPHQVGCVTKVFS